MKCEKRISICVISMNRLEHIKATFVKNIIDNQSYTKLEFVLLDYNSDDGLSHWVAANLSEYIRQGRVIYYHNREVNYFDMPHAKNMVTKLASGEIICLVDADNYTGKNFAKYINGKFSIESEVYVTTIYKRKLNERNDILGRVCFEKSHFYDIEGFDEKMNGYGLEDIDFVNRLDLLGLKRKVIRNELFLHAITHDNNERTSNLAVEKRMKHFFVSHITFFQSEFIYFFNNATYFRGKVTDNVSLFCSLWINIVKPKRQKFIQKYFLNENNWMVGKWSLNGNRLTMSEDDGVMVHEVRYDDGVFFVNELKFMEIEDQDLLGQVKYLFNVLRNQKKLEMNSKQQIIRVNYGYYGKGTVFKNFNYETPITL